jgi:hypothetical protein
LQNSRQGYEFLEWGKVATPLCGNGYVEGSWVTPVGGGADVWTCDKYSASYKPFGTTDTSKQGQCKEECDMGDTTVLTVIKGTATTGFNSPDLYSAIDATDPHYPRKYVCSKDCKWVENKFNKVSHVSSWDATKSKPMNPANAYKYAKQSDGTTALVDLPVKWSCTIATSSTSRSAEAPANP